MNTQGIKVTSDRVIIQSPMSVTGAVRRSWKLAKIGPSWAHIPMMLPAIILAVVWGFVALVWTIIFSVLLVPWRLLRRGQRKRKQEARRHAELLEAARRT